MSKKIITYLLLLIFLLALAACGGQDVAGEQAATPAATGVTDGDTAVAPSTDVADLPRLPGLSGGGGGGGGFGGGGGGVALAESDVAVEEPAPMPVEGDLMPLPFFENRLEGATFNLNTAVPGLPDATTVWQQTSMELTEERMRQLANSFGFSGPAYSDPWYDTFVQDNPGMWPGPRTYYFFDGPRTLSFYGTNLSYFDNSALPETNGWMPLPFEQARPIAEAFLNEHGLLDFDYEIVQNQYGGQEVAIHRLINGILTAYPEITVTVSPDNKVMSVYVQPFSAFTSVGNYPIISAEEAWALAQGTPDYQRIFQSVYADPATYDEPFVEGPAGDYRYWPRTYQNGEEITLYFYPIVYQAVDGSDPIIKANEFAIIANSADLQTIADNLNQNIRLIGVVQGDGSYDQSIRVSSVEVIGQDQAWQSREGTIRRADGQTYLDTVEGETLIIPNAPADLPDGEHVYVNGPAIEAGEPNGSFVWTGIDRVVAVVDEPIMIDEPVFPTPVPVNQVNIDKVELIYNYSYSPPAEDSSPGATWMQLAWRFTGRTDTNEIVELMVQAVSPEYLEAAPSN